MEQQSAVGSSKPPFAELRYLPIDENWIYNG